MPGIHCIPNFNIFLSPKTAKGKKSDCGFKTITWEIGFKIELPSFEICIPLFWDGLDDLSFEKWFESLEDSRHLPDVWKKREKEM